MTTLRKLTTKWTFDTTEYVQGVEKGIAKTRQLSATTTEGQKVLEGYLGKFKGKGKITADEFEVMSASVKKADRESRKASKTFDMMAKELQQETTMLKMGNDEREVYIAQMRLGAGATEQQKREVRELIQANQALRKSSGAVTSSMRLQRNSFSQMQFQLQDIAVQMQMGTNPFTILGQQGPQIAALFGPAGAVAGSIIAFGAMFGGVALSSLLDFKDATDKLKESQSELSEVLESATDEGVKLKEEFNRVAQSYGFLSDEIRDLAIQKQMKVITDSVGVLQDSFKDVKSEIATIDDSGAKSLTVGFMGGARIVSETKVELVELKGVIEELSKTGATQSNIDRLAAAIDALETKDASEEMKALKQTLIEQLGVLERSAQSVKALKDETKTLTDEEREGQKATNDQIDSIEDLIISLEEEAYLFGKTKDEIVLYNAALDGATPAQLEEIKRSQEIIRTKKEEAKAREEAAKAAEKEAKEAEKKQKSRIQKELKASLDAMKAEEQGRRDLEQMKMSIAQQGFDNLAEIAEEGSDLAKIAFLGQQAMAANKVMVDTAALMAKHADNAPMQALIEGQRVASLATIAGQTIAGVMHGGGSVDVPGGNHEATYLLKDGEYVESEAERRQIDNMLSNQQGEVNVNLSYNIQALDSKGVREVLMEHNETVFASVQQAARKQGRRL